MAAGAVAFDILNGTGRAGKTGSPGEQTCVQCHTGTALNGGPGSIAISSTPSLAFGYIAGSTYTVDVTVSESTPTNNALFGFGFEALFASGADAGTLTITNPTTTKTMTFTVTPNVRTNVVHTGTGNTGPNSQIFSFNWTAPATGSGTVTFYTTGNAADDSANTSGDFIYRDTLVVPEGFVGMAENAQRQNNLSVFPNPVSGNVNVSFVLQETSSVSLDLVALNGKKVANLISGTEKKGENRKTFNISSYPKSVYFLQLRDENLLSVKKLIII